MRIKKTDTNVIAAENAGIMFGVIIFWIKLLLFK